MAYPWHYLFSFGGTLLGGQEIWSNNIRFVGNGSADEVYDEQDIAQGLTEVMSAGFALTGAASLGYSSQVRLLWGKFNRIDPEGHYASDTQTSVWDLTAPGVPGQATPPTTTPQVALAVSWGTARARGTASRGRIYIPIPSVTPGLDARLSSGVTAGLAAAWAAQIDRLNDRAQNVGQERPIAAVVSSVDASWSPIQTVRVGNVLDTIRSRRNALEETYSVAAVPDSSA